MFASLLRGGGDAYFYSEEREIGRMAYLFLCGLKKEKRGKSLLFSSQREGR